MKKIVVTQKNYRGILQGLTRLSKGKKYRFERIFSPPSGSGIENISAEMAPDYVDKVGKEAHELAIVEHNNIALIDSGDNLGKTTLLSVGNQLISIQGMPENRIGIAIGEGDEILLSKQMFLCLKRMNGKTVIHRLIAC